MPANLTIPSVFTAIDKFTGPVRAMGRGVQGFAAKSEVAVAKASRAFRGLMTPLRAVNRMLGGFGLFLSGALLFGAISSSIGIFADFEQANSNLSAVLGKTSKETITLANDAKRLGASTAFTASQVVGLQTEFAKLGFSQREILGATESTLALAAATNTELPQAATQVGAALRAFGLDAKEAGRVADVFAASTAKSALDMSKLDAAMSTVSPVAKQFGFSIEDTVALLGKLSDAGFDASTAATSTRNIILNLADGNGKLAKALGKPARTLPDLVAGMEKLRSKGVDLAKMLDLTDKRSVAAFATFLDGAGSINELSTALQNAGGTAQKMAETQLDNLRGSMTILGSAWEGFILGLEDGRGELSKTLRLIVDVATKILNIFTPAIDGATQANNRYVMAYDPLIHSMDGFNQRIDANKLDQYKERVENIANSVIKWTKRLGYLVAGIIAFKALLIASRIALVAYNVVLGITGALSGTASIAIGANTIALTAYKITLGIVTAAQWLWNAALTANPIGLIIVGVAALITLIVVVVKKYQEWGAAVALLMGPLGMVINLIQSFRRNWDMITNAFKTEGMIAGFKAIGVAIMDALLMPLKQVFDIIHNLTGFDWAANVSKSIEDFRMTLGANVKTDESDKPTQKAAVKTDTSQTQYKNFISFFDAVPGMYVPETPGNKSDVINNTRNQAVNKTMISNSFSGMESILERISSPEQQEQKQVVNLEQSRQDRIIERIEKTNNAKVTLDVNDPKGMVTPKTESNFVEIKTGDTWTSN